MMCFGCTACSRHFPCCGRRCSLGKKTLLTLARRRGSTLAYLSSPILVCIVLIL